MADSTCAGCRLMGYRECDRCQGPVMPADRGFQSALGDLCDYCWPAGALHPYLAVASR
jgi:hypothetical protein